MKKIKIASLVLAVVLMTAACSAKETQDKAGDQVIRLASMPENENMVGWVADYLKSKGHRAEVLTYSSNQLPVTALKDGDIDGVIQNQLLWLEKFNEEHKTNLIMVPPYMYHGRVAIYSSKYQSLDELPRGSRLALPGDPSNMDQILVGLDQAGIIGLGTKLGNFYSLVDIVENPRDLEFFETERGTTARSYKDVDAIICGSTEARNAGIDHLDYLFAGFNDKDYPHGLIIRPEDIDQDWVKLVVEYSQTEEFKENLLEEFGSTFLPFEE